MLTQHKVHELVPEKKGHFINGAYTQPRAGETFANLAPAYDTSLGDVALGSREDIARAAEAAAAALSGPWGKSTPAERAHVLRRIAELLNEHRPAFARLESLDSGKPYSETLDGDIARSVANFQFFADLCAHQTNATYFGEDGTQHTSLREPLGIVGLITPWNLPLYLATWKLAPALAQGNTIILKPAELTPLTAMAMGHIFNAAGLPPGVVNIVQGFGGGGAGEALVTHPDVKAISFTGETTTGEAIMRASAPMLKKLSFELGGKGATVIFPDADLDVAAATAARAAFRNQGQICLAGSRLLVHRDVAAAVIDKVKAAMRAIKVGDPLDPTTTMGSLVSREHRDRVAGFVDYARTCPGVEILVGGKIPQDHPRGAYFEPTLIAGVDQSSRLIQEEVFGPVLTVQVFSDEDEAISLVNGTQYGLSCSVFTKDIDRAQRFARRVRMGLVWINTWFARDLHSAFGGMKRSGIGREGGQYSLDFFSEFKTISMAMKA